MKKTGILPFEEKARRIIAKAMTEYDQGKKGCVRGNKGRDEGNPPGDPER